MPHPDDARLSDAFAVIELSVKLAKEGRYGVAAGILFAVNGCLSAPPFPVIDGDPIDKLRRSANSLAVALHEIQTQRDATTKGTP